MPGTPADRYDPTVVRYCGRLIHAPANFGCRGRVISGANPIWLDQASCKNVFSAPRQVLRSGAYRFANATTRMLKGAGWRATGPGRAWKAEDLVMVSS